VIGNGRGVCTIHSITASVSGRPWVSKATLEIVTGTWPAFVTVTDVAPGSPPTSTGNPNDPEMRTAARVDRRYV